jgi:hypothetical protein
MMHKLDLEITPEEGIREAVKAAVKNALSPHEVGTRIRAAFASLREVTATLKGEHQIEVLLVTSNSGDRYSFICDR